MAAVATGSDHDDEDLQLGTPESSVTYPEHTRRAQVGPLAALIVICLLPFICDISFVLAAQERRRQAEAEAAARLSVENVRLRLVVISWVLISSSDSWQDRRAAASHGDALSDVLLGDP